MENLLIFLIIGDQNNNLLDGMNYECCLTSDHVTHSEACNHIQNYFKENYNYKIASNEIKSSIRDNLIEFCCDAAKNNNVIFFNASSNDSRYGILTLPKTLTPNEYNSLKKYEDILNEYYLDVKIFDNENEIHNNKIYNNKNELIGFVNPFKVDDYYENYQLKNTECKVKKLY